MENIKKTAKKCLRTMGVLPSGKTIPVLTSEDGFSYQIFEKKDTQDKYIRINGINSECDVLTIPEKISGIAVEVIKKSAFQGNAKLVQVKIPEGIRVIGAEAFKDCINLEMVELPPELKVINRACFQGCSALKAISIPYGVENLCQDAFDGCKMLDGLKLPEKLSHIGKNAFDNSLTKEGNMMVKKVASVQKDKQKLNLAEKMDNKKMDHHFDKWRKIKLLFPRKSKEMTLKKMCMIMGVEVPNKFKNIEDQINNDITLAIKRVKPGSIYIVMYDKVNLKAHIEKAIQSGATIIFVDKSSFENSKLNLEEYPVILLEHKIQQVGDLFYTIRASYPRMKTIAITGTVGKTTTNLLLQNLVKSSYNTFASGGNLNSYAAVGNHIMNKLSDEVEVYIQECGAGDINSIRKSACMLRPDAFILLNVKQHHMNTYKTYENLFDDKSSFDDYLSDDGVIIANFDDEGIATHQFKHQVVSFGINTDRAVDFRAVNIRQHKEKLQFDILYADKTVPVKIEILGEHNAYNALAAFAMSKWLNIDDKYLVDRFANYRSKGIRANLKNIGGKYLYVDCYNACEASILATFEAMERFNLEQGAKKIAVIGGENKLGALAKEVHYRIGTELIHNNIDDIVFLGNERQDPDAIDRYGDAYSMQEGYASTEEKSAEVLTNLEDVQHYLETKMERGDLAFFKCVLWHDLTIAIDKAFGTAFTYDYEYYTSRCNEVSSDYYMGRVHPDFGEVELLKPNKIDDGRLTIPDMMEGYPVFRIGKAAFKENDQIKHIDFGQSIKNIGRGAFYQCNQLLEINIPGNVKVIERGAFRACRKVERITLSEGVTHIGQNAFRNCFSLKDIYLPDSIGNIEEGAFFGCKNIQIVANKGTYAEEYAKENGIKFTDLMKKRGGDNSLTSLKTKLGFGFNRLPYLPETKTPDYKIAQEAVDTYLKSGGKYFETGYNYMNFQSEDIARKCLVEKYHREDFFLCAKMPIRFKVVFEQGYQAVFEQQLKKCGVEYFDVYLLHNLGGKLYEKVKKTGGFDFLKKIKREGKAKLVGFSFHDKAEALEYILSQEPDIDIVQLQINYQDWDSSAIQSRLCYEVATKYNKTVTVMEPLKGGNLVNRLPEGAEELISQSFYTPASLGLKWVASLDNTAVVLSGMSAPEQTIANAEALMMPCQLEEDGYKLIADVLQLFEKKKLVDCTNCGYCLDVCPKNIPINDIFQLLNNESENGKRINRNANMFYQRNVSGKGKASDCIKCGKCEDICSQRLQIRRELENAVKIFE